MALFTYINLFNFTPKHEEIDVIVFSLIDALEKKLLFKVPTISR